MGYLVAQRPFDTQDCGLRSAERQPARIVWADTSRDEKARDQRSGAWLSAGLSAGDTQSGSQGARCNAALPSPTCDEALELILLFAPTGPTAQVLVIA